MPDRTLDPGSVGPADGYDPGERLVRVEVGLGLLSTQVGSIQSTLERVEHSVGARPPAWFALMFSLSTAANGALVAAVTALLVVRK